MLKNFKKRNWQGTHVQNHATPIKVEVQTQATYVNW